MCGARVVGSWGEYGVLSIKALREKRDSRVEDESILPISTPKNRFHCFKM
jgi:hypothetical protein